MQRKI